VYQGNSLAQGVVQGWEGVEEVIIEFNWTFYHSKRYIVIKHIKNETKKDFPFTAAIASISITFCCAGSQLHRW
jgi:hypothetical protein